MVSKAIKCIHCESENIVKNGKHQNNKQRLKCKKCGKTFQEEYTNHTGKTQYVDFGGSPEPVKQPYPQNYVSKL
jgi:predicted Zn finger-like uncharacterized protein